VYSSLRERSRLLRLMRRVVSDPELLVTRCAWCRRYAFDCKWVEIGETPRFLLQRITRSSTHSICPLCFDDLRTRGLSA
jgi:hypothetical protein